MKRLFLAALLGAPLAHAAEPLPSFRTDPAGITVSGLSSGAYMAGQMHVAFSDRISGAGLVAGGPYGCATGSVAFALQRCTETTLGAPDPAALVARAKGLAAAGRIAPLENLADDPVYVFGGTEDRTVLPAVVRTAAEFYALAGVPEARILFKDDLAAGHAFLTEDQGAPCAATRPPYVNDCDYDQAGAILGHLLGPLNRPAAPTGRTIAFDQAEFLPDPTRHGMALEGFAYVPPACEAGGCRVHVAFHGCRQTAGMVGDAFTATTGYDRWAETNRLIVLFPQTHDPAGDPLSRNPRACWDWWGYDDPAHATRTGRQMRAVAGMLDRLEGRTEPPAESCARIEAGNLAHWQAGRARVCEIWFLCAVGSGENIGFGVGQTVLYEHPAGNFTTSACAG